MYSSSVYSRVLEEFEEPEVLTRPLEDVVLAMKAMEVGNVKDFPFPTPLERGRLRAALRLLGDVGCVDLEEDEEGERGDGMITKLGAVNRVNAVHVAHRKGVLK